MLFDEDIHRIWAITWAVASPEQNSLSYTDNFGGKAGKSISYVTAFEISGGTIRIFCTDWDKKNITSKNLDYLLW